MDAVNLTNAQARRFILRWQGLLGAHRFTGAPGVVAYLRQAGCVQYDPVNLCGRNAELALLARVRGFNPDTLPGLLYKKRALVDHWDKNMSLFPAEDWPALSRNRDRFRGWSYTGESMAAVHGAIPAARAHLEAHPHITSADLAMDTVIDWPWGSARLGRAVLEYMYFTGELVIHHREGSRRWYAPAGRHLPKALLTAPDPHPGGEAYLAWHTLRRVSAVGLLWNRPSNAFLAIPEHAAGRDAAFEALLRDGRLIACRAEGIKEPLYAPAAARTVLDEVLGGKRLARRLELLPPLDALLWDRRLVRAVFGFDYKWEIYTPAEKRKYAPYVLPVLWGQGFAGRLYAVADRKAGLLRLEGWWPEPGFTPDGAFRKQLAAALGRLAAYNGCAVCGEGIWAEGVLAEGACEYRF